jgi:hypothetical protein
VEALEGRLNKASNSGAVQVSKMAHSLGTTTRTLSVPMFLF